jgi:hypothetical protein
MPGKRSATELYTLTPIIYIYLIINKAEYLFIKSYWLFALFFLL